MKNLLLMLSVLFIYSASFASGKFEVNLGTITFFKKILENLMKKSALLVAVTLSISLTAQATTSRSKQSMDHFLKQANNPKTAIAEKLQKTREALASGYLGEDDVIPNPLKSKDVKMVESASELYLGTFRGSDAESDKGYEQRTFDVYVSATDVSYGGRITTTSPVKFQCTLTTKAYDAELASVTCQ